MAARIRIAIDCMGGDFGLRVSLPAAVKAQRQFADLDIVLVGDKPSIETQLKPSDLNSFELVHAPEQVSMSERPSVALRKKKQSSMRIAIDLLQQNRVDAVVSAGNTGALMAIGCFVLKTLPGIDRPAICSALPSADGQCYLLDLGANVDSSARHLHQFAIMGAALASVVDGIDNPRVAVLNIGEEAVKGSAAVKSAVQLLEADQQLNCIGSIEGGGVFSGKADVIVCDGFVGNVALKICEGTAGYISSVVKNQFRQGVLARLAALLAMPVLKRIYQKLDPQRYNGASLLGLQGVVVKSHGNSSVEGLVRAIAQARLEVDKDMLTLIASRLSVLPD